MHITNNKVSIWEDPIVIYSQAPLENKVYNIYFVD